MINSSRVLKLFIALLSIQLLPITLPAFSQSASPKSVQMDTDWEKIRDAQVQMLRKKEAELDRLKEDLLTRAQPQARTQTGLPEVEAEFKKREADWLQKSDRYENEITLLTVKVEEQKNEIDTLRLKLNDILQKQPTSKQEKLLNQKTITATVLNSADLERRESQLKLQEKQLQDMRAEWELRIKQSQQAKVELSELEKEKIKFQNQISNWEASQLQANQKNEAERLQIKTERHAFEKGRADLAAETESFNVKLAELKSASIQVQELLKRETAITSQEQQLRQKQTDLDGREKRLADTQKQADEEKRLWLSKKAQVDQSLSQKLADAEGQLAKLQDVSLTYEFDRKNFAKQIADLQGQVQAEKGAAAEREVNWKKREQDLLLAQSGGNSKVAELQSRLSKQQSDFSQKENDWKIQLVSASQKLEQMEAQLKAADSSRQSGEAQSANQFAEREKEWADKVTDFERKCASLSAFEMELNKKSAALEAQSLHLEEKSKALSQEREEFSNQTRAGSSSKVSNQAISEILELRQMLEQSKNENESWRQSKRQVEQNWAEFVSKEMQYQMQISELQKENQKLQQKIAAAISLQAVPQRQNDTGRSEDRRIVDERRALGEEKARLYRQVTQDRQAFEQAQIQFSRQQREFEHYVQSEQARLEKVRRQAGPSSR